LKKVGSSSGLGAHATPNFALAMITPSLQDWVDQQLKINDVMKNIRDSMRFGIPRLSKAVEKEAHAALERI
jgi:hypothetical protein